MTVLLYFGKPFLLPLAFSVLLAFLLAPVVAWLEGLHLGRAVSVCTVALLAFGLLGIGFYIVSVQLVDLVNELPRYRQNLQLKIFTPLEHVSSVFTELAKEFQPAKVPINRGGPMPVEVVAGQLSVIGVARDLAGPLVSLLGSAAIVFVNVVFFLFDRDSLRDRFIHLMGRGRLHVTTQVLEDAAERVSRYLGAQLLVNATYGIPIGIGLFVIGIPNAALWGVLTILFRFIPYVGAWCSAALPVVLSLAISPSWGPPLATLTLFITMELISNNVIEPWLYGASTGLSPSAIVVSATFWTWLWGAGGLLLATPLTVCLAVMGKYVPRLGFLDILLGDQPPIAPEHRFYQRLLAGDHEEVDETIASYLKRDRVLELFDEVILPALHLTEQDLRNGSLDPEELKIIYAHLREALGAIEGFQFADDDQIHGVAIIPARSEGDALAGAMLGYTLRSRGISCTWFSERTLVSEIQARLVEKPEVLLCLSALTPSAARAASTIFRRLSAPAAGMKLLGFWNGQRAIAMERLSQTDIAVATSLVEAVRLIASSSSQSLKP